MTGTVLVVDEVLQSGRETYTVFCVDRRDERRRSDGMTDLATELLEVARNASEVTSETAATYDKYVRYVKS